ncbi:MAG: cyclic nucleotide-binding domain-containing protein [Myxococcota bacterium]
MMKSSSIERLLALRVFPGFRDVPAESISPLARYAEDRMFEAGATILEEGSPVTRVHFVLEGQVKISRSGMPFRLIEPGQGFGALAALAQVQHGVTATAVEKTRTLELASRDLELVFLEHFDLLSATLRALTKAVGAERRQLPGGGYSPEIDEGDYPPLEMTLIERLVAYKNSLLIQNHRVDALAQLARSSTERRFEPGDALWAQGELSPWVFHIVAGRVRYSGDDGVSFDFGAGGFVGALDAMNVEGRRYQATAVAPTVALAFHVGDLIDILEDHTYMALDFVRGVAEDLFTVLGQRRRYAADDSPL